MANPEVDTIVKDYKQAQATHDFSHLTFDIGQLQRKDGMNWQQDATEINKQLQHLGFNDFQIVGTDNKGRLVTTSTDGKDYQTRDPIHWNVENSTANSAKTEQWGNRQFTVNPDGSSHYDVKPGDNYWSVVKDALQARDPSKPVTSTDIANTLQELAQHQGRPVNDLNKLHPGDSIDIPMPTPAGDGTYAAKTPAKVTGDVNDPINPPGTNGDYNKDATKTTTDMDHETGFSTSKTSGELNDSTLNALTFGLAGHGTHFDSTQVTDRDGHLISRDTKYGSPIDYTFVDQSGAMKQIGNVTDVSTRFNNYSGTYETTITDKDGKTYAVSGDGTGKTSKISPSPDDYIPPMAYYP